jgi:hypothetical protein
VPKVGVRSAGTDLTPLDHAVVGELEWRGVSAARSVSTIRTLLLTERVLGTSRTGPCVFTAQSIIETAHFFVAGYIDFACVRHCYGFALLVNAVW